MSSYEEYVKKIKEDEEAQPPENLLIRRARIGDSASLAKLTLERDGGSFEEIEKKKKKELEKIEKSDDTLLLIAEIDKKIVGFARSRYFNPSENSPRNIAPPGWYLMGIIIAKAFRRQGIGRLLTRQRIEWLRERTDRIYYFANKRNRVSIELHQDFGFREMTRNFIFPGAIDQAGEGILFELNL